MNRTWQKRGFTLVELLVVVTIIAILIALLLPAVQVAREAARRMQCQNHIKQLALGCVSHETATGRYPTGGWGFGWTGDADRGTDWRQPGGWLYNVLPFIDQQPLHDLGVGIGQWDDANKLAANLRRIATPLDTFYCPSRRVAKSYPYTTSGGGCANVSPSPPTMVGRSDYAANGGDAYTSPSSGGPAWAYFSNPEGGPSNPTQVENPLGQMSTAARSTFAGVAKAATGIVYTGSLVTPADVTDGTTSTYLLGEKYCNPDSYETGNDPGDNESALVGDNEDTTRWTIGITEDFTTAVPSPQPDTPGFSSRRLFGSPHTQVFNMAFCDGSVQPISYSIEPVVHCRLGNRKDGMTIDGSSY